MKMRAFKSKAVYPTHLFFMRAYIKEKAPRGDAEAGDYMKSDIIPMGLEDIPAPFRKYMKDDFEKNKYKKKQNKQSKKQGDMLFMLLVVLILFDL